MAEILIPFRIEDLLLKPEMAGRIKLSEDMQQTLASLVGYNGVARRLLKCSDKGVLHTTTSRIDGIEQIKAFTAPYDWQGSDKKTTEVMIMGYPLNGALVWVKNDEPATLDNSWPLSAKEILSLTIDNLRNLYIHFTSLGDIALIAWTR